MESFKTLSVEEINICIARARAERAKAIAEFGHLVYEFVRRQVRGPRMITEQYEQYIAAKTAK